MKMKTRLCAMGLVLGISAAAFAGDPPAVSGSAQAAPAPAAAGTLSGKYVGENTADSWFIFKPDGTVTLHEANQDMTGTYKVDGDTLTLTIGTVTVKAKISGDEILPAEGGHGQPMKKQ